MDNIQLVLVKPEGVLWHTDSLAWTWACPAHYLQHAVGFFYLFDMAHRLRRKAP